MKVEALVNRLRQSMQVKNWGSWKYSRIKGLLHLFPQPVPSIFGSTENC